MELEKSWDVNEVTNTRSRDSSERLRPETFSRFGCLLLNTPRNESRGFLLCIDHDNVYVPFFFLSNICYLRNPVIHNSEGVFGSTLLVEFSV